MLLSHTDSASVSQPAADFCPVFMLSALCCDFNYMKCNFFFLFSKTHGQEIPFHTLSTHSAIS